MVAVVNKSGVPEEHLDEVLEGIFEKYNMLQNPSPIIMTDAMTFLSILAAIFGDKDSDEDGEN